MRTTSLTVAALLLVAGVAAAQDGGSAAQQPPEVAKPGEPAAFLPPNQIDIGLRGTSYGSDSDPARHQRYRDVRDGGTVDRFRLFKDSNEYRYTLQADHLGYRDQRLSAGFTNFGRIKASFEWKIGRAS